MIWETITNMKPRFNHLRRLSLEEFLENYEILKVSGDLELYQNYIRMEKRIINLYGESFLKELLRLKETELNGEELND
ncbi:MAG: hypothetical protein ACTSQE_17355 [Candidatus Heimdallarchaeaceae archaeon]